MDIGGHSGIPPVSPDKGCIPADTHGMLSGTVSPAGRCPGSHCGPACVMAFMEVREGEWVNGKYGMQLQVEQWREVVPKTKEGVLSYLGSGLIKGIGEKTAVEIVAKFGTNI